MNSDVQPEAQAGQSPGGGLAFGDILFTLFRHRLLILSSVVLGLIAAVLVRFVKPPVYESTAKIYLPYIITVPAINTKGSEDTIAATGIGADAQMATEVEILKALDTAKQVAEKIGPEKILAKYGGGTNLDAAAGVVASGIWVAPPRTMSLTVTFTHRDRDLVQPITEAVVKAYMRRHHDIRIGDGGFYVEKAQEAEKKISDIDKKLKIIKTEAGVPDIHERQNAVNKEYADLQAQVLKAQTELARRKAELGELSSHLTSLNAKALPADTITAYSETMGQIEEIRKKQRNLLLDDLTTNHPSVVKLELKLQQQLKAKQSLEDRYPALTNYIGALPRGGGTNGASELNLEAELALLDKQSRTIKSDEDTLGKLKDEAFRLMEIEPKLTELERQREAAEKDYLFYRSNIEKSKMDDGKAGGVINMQELDTPTPPKLDNKKLLKLLGVAFGGCVGAGLGLAFLIDMLLDRNIRRPSQIVKGLKIPVILTIPDSNRVEAGWLPWSKTNRNTKVVRAERQTNSASGSALAAWTPDNQLQSHIEGLRERVITHFEVQERGPGPKLVAVTACASGAGVSTLSRGLAAALSRTGNGSVLLVDMSSEEGVTHSFYKGKPGYGPAERMESDDEPVQPNENLSLAKISNGHSRRMPLEDMLPPEFKDARPKLKATAYDYVVFDMAAITPASVTPRMSGHMDLVLFVVESEKTKDYAARNACNLMKDSRANVRAILNKYYNPVPGWLAHD